MSMRRMPFNAEALEKLSKEIVYNKETNTIEIGGNVYVDGEIKPTFEKKFKNGDWIAIFEICQNYAYSEQKLSLAMVNQVEGEGHTYYGIGVIDDSINVTALIAYNYVNDELSFLNVQYDADRLDVDRVFEFSTKGDIPTYYEHQLMFTNSDDENFGCNYYSKSSLPIDSPQDLTLVVKPNANTRLMSGSFAIIYADGIWKTMDLNNPANSIPITKVTDNVVIVD